MKACPSCEQNNADDANFCARCGTPLAQEATTPHEEAASAPLDEQQYWQEFIGPTKSIQFSLKAGLTRNAWSWRPASIYYLEKFRRFQSSAGHRFALSWHWPVFILDPFLWFLYRKIYMYALLYFIGPGISVYLTGDLSVVVVWRILAGTSANYIYYWHIKDHLQRIRSQAKLDFATRIRLVKEEGGVQLYVLWLGMALYLFYIGMTIAVIVLFEPTEEGGLALP